MVKRIFRKPKIKGEHGSTAISDEDLKWAEKYQDKHGLINPGEIPSAEEIKGRMETLDVTQAEIDADAAVCVLGRFIKAYEEDRVHNLLDEAYYLRKKRPYSVKTPFGVLLQAWFPRYKGPKASKMGMFIRSKFHQGWSLDQLRLGMKKWQLEKSYKQALEDEGLQKRQGKTHTPNQALSDDDEEKINTLDGPRKHATEHQPEDDIALDTFDGELQFKSTPSDEGWSSIFIPPPPRSAQLSSGKAVYEFSYEGGKLLEGRWLTEADIKGLSKYKSKESRMRKRGLTDADRRKMRKRMDELRASVLSKIGR